MKAILKSADAEGIGEYAPGAAEKIKTASEAAFNDISKAAARYVEQQWLGFASGLGLGIVRPRKKITRCMTHFAD